MCISALLMSIFDMNQNPVTSANMQVSNLQEILYHEYTLHFTWI